MLFALVELTVSGVELRLRDEAVAPPTEAALRIRELRVLDPRHVPRPFGFGFVGR